MRLLYFMLAVPFLCQAQTAKEREKIVATYNQTEIAKAKEEAKQHAAEQRLLIEAYKAKFHPEESEKHSLQRIDNGLPIFFTTFNDGSSKTIRANSMYPGGTLGLSITGTEMTAGVWDGGKVRSTHQELNGRAWLGDAATDLSAHATHVTGTIIASGVSPTRRGIAYGADAITHDWDDDYNEMLTFGSQGYLVSNHSYGYSTDGLPTWKFGSYDGSSIEVDQVTSLHPYYQVVIAAGNDRSNMELEQFLKGGYDLLSGTGVSKNGITVAAVEQLLNYSDAGDVVMSDFSNFGPPDDGRIKPDISAKGVNTSSCVSQSNGSYEIFSGTSMAAPAISGLIVLLQKHHDNGQGFFMRASTVRGLLCHSVREAGASDGPDYEFGWGLADGLAAANIITNKNTSTILDELTLGSSQTYTRNIVINSTQKLTATICWTDPAGNPNVTGAIDPRAARLKNNLDLKILKDGVTYYPWKLDPEDQFSPATNDSDNDVDNVEKVEIYDAEPGVYTIQVTHKGTLTGGSQVFSLIASGSTGLSLATNEVNFDDKLVLYPNPVQNTLNIAVPNNGQVENLSIFDVLGKQVMNSTGLGNSVDVSGLTSGIYFVQFNYNGISMTKKFVKE